MSEIVEGLGGSERNRIAALRGQGRYFWIDLCLAEVPRDELVEALDVPPHALEVNVLVHGDYLLTVHRERVSLPEQLPGYSAEGRSEQYIVYAVLDAMVATAFDALNDTELALEGLQVLAGNAGDARMRMGTLRAISVRLTKMRRQLGPQRGIFERISQEIGQVEGLVADNERYFERIYEQLNRVVDGIDAASDSMTKLIDLRLNETMYWLTVVATIFLPLTFLTGFFGMNFAWMIKQIDTPLAFVLLGVGLPLFVTTLTYMLIQRRGTPVQRDPNSIERTIGVVARAARAPVPKLLKSTARSRWASRSLLTAREHALVPGDRA